MEVGLENTTLSLMRDNYSTSEMGRGETDDQGREHARRFLRICVWSEHCSFLIEQHLVQVGSDVGSQDTQFKQFS